MPDYVVDTNVWVMLDKPISQTMTLADLDCIQACRAWLEGFMAGQDRLVIDLLYRILGEYRRNIPQGGRAAQILGRLETQPRARLIEHLITLDAEDCAVLPPDVPIPDANDRKFVAVALAHEPRPPLVNATESDWTKVVDVLATHGIALQELCPQIVADKLRRDRLSPPS